VIVERVSIELTNRCGKACWFCYNGSRPAGEERWTADEIVGFGRSLAAHGTRAISFGGGEPLEAPGLLFPALRQLDGVVFRSLTTNGLLLDEAMDDLVAARPDKVHVSLHMAENRREVERVIAQVGALRARGVKSGVNLLVMRSRLAAATHAARALRDAGIGNERIVYLPMRGTDTPAPDDVAAVAGGRFQSMTCLTGCAASPRFASVSWDRQAAWCSYTAARRPLPSLDHAGLAAALAGAGLTYCGDDDDHGRPVRLSRRPQHGHGLVRGGP
jgi:sulfatase maturation enzyme AslB (radical SAM superfamily)